MARPEQEGPLCYEGALWKEVEGGWAPGAMNGPLCARLVVSCEPRDVCAQCPVPAENLGAGEVRETQNGGLPPTFTL